MGNGCSKKVLGGEKSGMEVCGSVVVFLIARDYPILLLPPVSVRHLGTVCCRRVKVSATGSHDTVGTFVSKIPPCLLSAQSPAVHDLDYDGGVALHSVDP